MGWLLLRSQLMLKLKIICILICLALLTGLKTAEMPLYEGVVITLQAEPTLPDLPIEPAMMQAAGQTFAGGLQEAGVGYVSAWVVDGERLQLDVRGLASLDKAIDALQPGLLEVLDGGNNPPAVGEYVNTDLGSPSPEALRDASVLPGATRTPGPPPKYLHDVVMGFEIDSSSVEVKASGAGMAAVILRDKIVPVDARRDLPPKQLDGYLVVALGKRVVGMSRASLLGPGEIMLTGLRPDEAQRLAGYLRRGALPTGFQVVDTRRLPGTPMVEGWR
ncbi:MAG: hypothetical protein ACJ78Q_08115 [Chloroflexia bacterium]